MPVDLTQSPLGSPLATRMTRDQLRGLSNCPYCGVASPILQSIWYTQGIIARGDGGLWSEWACYRCTSCGGIVAAMGVPGESSNQVFAQVARIFPAARAVSSKLPPIAAEFLRQAFGTLHAPDAAAVMAGSAVDAMLKHLGYTEGSLYHRIDQARDASLLTSGMADWAHSVRLGSNRPRHVDADKPHVSSDEAQRSVDFAEALGNFLFVLSAQIADAARAAEGSKRPS